MALGTLNSFMLSSFLSVMLFSVMQIFKSQLASSEWLTIFGGFVGSILFVFLLTAFNNLETILFGDNFQAKFFPEVLTCIVMAMIASGMVHRVCITTCFIFSAIALFYLNRISAAKYQAPATPSAAKSKSKKKKH